MPKGKIKIEKLTVAKVKRSQVPGDVLERIDGYEVMDGDNATYSRSQPAMTMYDVKSLKKILTDKEDDTNATTKYRIELLYNQVKSYDYLLILSWE